MNEYTKDKRSFWRFFPRKKPKFDHVKNWFKAFRFFCYVFTNEGIGSAPISNDQLPEWIKPILLLYEVNKLW